MSKSAMQELMDKVQSINERYEIKGDANWLMNEIIDLIESSLEKEKEQMFYWFYGGGGLSATDDFREEFENNYNQTYKQEIEKQII